VLETGYPYTADLGAEVLACTFDLALKANEEANSSVKTNAMMNLFI
jgi:hypothetical protein